MTDLTLTDRSATAPGTEPDRAALRRAVLARRLAAQAPTGRSADRRPAAQPTVPRLPRDGVLPLSAGQHRLWLLDQLGTGGAAYLVPVGLRLRGALDTGALDAALTEIVARHEVLRTRCAAAGGEGVQLIDAPAPLAAERLDLAGLPDDDRENRLAEVLDTEGRRAFDLSAERPVRALLVRLAADEHLLVVTVHHIAFDGWSADLLTSELTALYRAFSAGDPSPLEPLSVQYADVCAWQEQRLSGPDGQAQLAYWREALSGLAPLPLPTDRPYPPEWDDSGAVVDLDLPAQLGDELVALGRGHGATPFMTVLAALHALLARYSGQPDVAVGAPIAGRTLPQSQALIGYFANTLVLRADTSDDPSFAELLDRARESALAAYSHQDVPFDLLVKELRPGRDLGRNPLFQVSLTVDTVTAGTTDDGPLTFTPERIGWAPAKFDLAFALQQRPDGSFAGQLGYATALFDRTTAERMAAHFIQLVRAAVAHPERRINALDLRTARERRAEPAAALVAASESVPVHNLIARQAAARPEAVAVTSDGERLTYAELDTAANRLAHELRARGAGPGTLVGVRMRRGAALITALLGVLRSGAAYLPLDPDQPADRLVHMLQDAGAAILLTEQALPAPAVDTLVHILELDDPDLSAALTRHPAEAPESGVTADDLAYVIYTSGSTGRPKGVMVTHRNVARLFTTTAGDFAFGTDDVWTFFHSYAFDFSVWEIWGALAHGGRLVVVPFEVSRSPQDLLRLLADEQVTVLNQTPSAFSGLVTAALADETAARRLALRTVVFGGEALDTASLLPWFDRFGDKTPQLVNMYGITETTVHVTHRPMTAADSARGTGRGPIGGPIPDLRFHILDEAMNPVPVGVPGEIYIGGPGVARGYLGRPALTASRFVPDPFSGGPGARLYRAGDRARRLPDGEVEFLGRVDGQVKIRGFRIELGEIESALTADEQVDTAAVTVHETAAGDRQLVGYLVPAPGVEPDLAVLRASLAARLPSYMIPAAFVRLDTLPLTANGKADRRALPAPGADRLVAGAEYVAPRTAAEQAVADVWREVLDLGHVGALDNFFELGGDSIRAVRVVGRLRELGFALTVQDLFRRQTVAGLAAPLTEAAAPVRTSRTERFALLDAADRDTLEDGVEDAYPLSEAQSGMVYELLADPEKLLYHNVTSYLVRDDGPFSAEALRTAVDTVTARHELLRTSFDLSYSEPLQLVHAEARIEIREQDLRALPPKERAAAVHEAVCAERAEPLELTGALWRLRIIRESDKSWRLLFVECHAILDGWSHNSLLTELLHRYRAARSGAAQTGIEPPAVRFADFIALEREATADPAHTEFWAGRLADGEALTLPDGWGDPQAGPGTYDLRISFHDKLAALQELGRSAGASLKSVLLAAHVTVLRRLTDQPRPVCGLVANGRPEELDGDRTLGMHLNVVPFLPPAGAHSWRELVAAVFAEEVALLPHRRYPLAAMRRTEGATLPALDVMFNYLNFHVLDENLVDTDASVDDSPNEFPLAVSTEWGRIVLTLDPRRVSRERGELIAELYTRVLAAMADDPDAAPHLELPPDEQHRALHPTAVMAGGPVPSRPLTALVNDWITATPEATALVYGEDSLSYRALGERSAELAGRLVALGIRPGDRVAICLPRGMDVVVAILAVARAGAAFVPLDPAHPDERLAYVLTDAAVTATVTSPETAERLGIPPDRVITPGDLGHPPVAQVPLTDSDLAYVFYTSGSTGRPKGVMIEHRGIANLIDSHARLLGVRPGDRMMQFSAPVFDVSVLESLLALGNGATLILAPAAELMPGAPLSELIRRQKADHLITIPSALALLAPEDGAPRTVSVIGEACPESLVTRWSGHSRFFNLYGPTEYTVVTSGEEVVPGVTGRPTIGRPLPDTRAVVLDGQLRPVPAGVPGELCVGGIGIGRGYLGRPGLTADRFVPDPYAATPGARLYRTGDRARLLADGRIDYLGRLDFQVKVRGFRIELGEIEAVLHAHPAVSQAVAVVRHDSGDPRIVAYLTPREETPTEDELIAHLRRSVPEYMVPSHFVVLDTMPTTGSGKINRKALPAPGRRPETGRTVLAPRTALERRIADVWAEVLGVDEIGIEDDFFRAGGHSLLAMRAVARLRAAAGIETGIAAMLRHRTVAALARAVADGFDPGTRGDLVTLRQSSEGEPAFLVHPGGGSVHWFRHLAEEIAPGPVLAFEHPGLADSALADATVDTLAGRYLDQLRAHRPHGPYRLLGWCAGGPIAWEMARRLTAESEHVRLVLLDPVADTQDGDLDSTDLELFDHTGTLLRELRAAPDGARADELRRAAVPLLQRIVDDGGLVITEETVNDGFLERIEVWRALRAATVGHRYRPAPVELDLIVGDELAQAAHPAIGGLGYREYLRRWTELAGGGLRVHRVPGSHLGVLKPPHLSRLATAVDTAWRTGTGHTEKES